MRDERTRFLRTLGLAWGSSLGVLGGVFLDGLPAVIAGAVVGAGLGFLVGTWRGRRRT